MDTTATGTRILRVEVRPRDGAPDPLGAGVARRAGAIGLEPARVRCARVYLIEGRFDDGQIERIGGCLLADPVLQSWLRGADEPAPRVQVVEVHPLPGVMDPVAQTVADAVEDLTGVRPAHVSTGMRYDIEGLSRQQCERLARRQLANTLVQSVSFEAWTPDRFPALEPADQRVVHVAICDLDDDALRAMSRDKHLFLSLEEMRAIREYYRRAGREPTDAELETLAQTWSEHCVHKTLKSTVRYTGTLAPEDDPIDWSNRPGHTVGADGSVTIDNLLRSTVAAATHELIDDGLDWALSVFVDNAGVIAYDDEHAICMKVETHNHPSALEPYGGSATGVGGCIRDIMGTGLGARPIANTDVFCVADPRGWSGEPAPGARTLPAGCLHPRRVLERVVDGVRDYGNRMGIPTVNGAVFFDDRYVGNPLVFCGCVGIMPRDKVAGEAKPGDLIVALGGRTGRDGIHGATFSSAELTDTHADEFSHAVQIGNAIEEKRTLDAILRARDHESGCLYSAITDCGAGGFSSAVGEMGEKVGAEVDLERAPLKYDGLRYDEIWISESQERMVLSVPAENLDALRGICEQEHAELAVLGRFGHRDEAGEPELLLRFKGAEVARLSMALLHEGVPMPTREAYWNPGKGGPSPNRPGAPAHGSQDVGDTLLTLLAHPNIASKRWIVNQYDHEVQGNTVIKPLVGPGGIGPGDATVIEPVPGSGRGIAIANGLEARLGHPDTDGADPYRMALAAVDECVRNLVCVGADPSRIAILDNFCWPSCNDPRNMASLVRAAEGCYDAARAYGVPFISGKDSLNNQFRTDEGELIEIPPTLLISGVGIVPDISKCVTMDMKGESLVMLVGPGERPAHDVAACVAGLIRAGLVRAAHDCSEGGWLVALAEMLIAGDSADAPVGAAVECDAGGCFEEAPGRYLLEVSPGDRGAIEQAARGLNACVVAGVDASGELKLGAGDRRIPVAVLRDAFTRTLDW